MSEEEIEIIDYFKEVIKWYRENTPDRVYSLNDKDIEIMQRLLDLYIRAKERNKDLNFENQSLFESIDCNDDNMLARRYQNIKKETKILKDKIRDIIKDLDDFDIYIFDIKAFKLALKNSLEELLKE